MSLRLGRKEIGEGYPSYIIAEAGANFCISENAKTNFRQALKLIEVAANAGADAVKFQVYRAEKLYARNSGYADYIGKKEEIFSIIRKMELPYEWLMALKRHAVRNNIDFLATPFDTVSADELEKTGISAFKVASYSITDYHLLKNLARRRKPIILSVGASATEEIDDAVKHLRRNGASQIVLLQCTAKYPSPLSAINLRVITFLRARYGCAVGLSDHSREPLIAPMGAVALGANIVEKHFTTDNKLPGPDHGFAVLPHELALMVESIRKLESALGTSKKGVLPEEKELRSFARHYLFATTQIRKGSRFSEKNVGCLRPGKAKKGISARYFEEVLGKIAKRDIQKGRAIDENDF